MVFKKGDTSWSKGLTKETDRRLVISGKRISKTKKKMKLTPWNKGLTKDF